MKRLIFIIILLRNICKHRKTISSKYSIKHSYNIIFDFGWGIRSCWIWGRIDTPFVG